MVCVGAKYRPDQWRAEGCDLLMWLFQLCLRLALLQLFDILGTDLKSIRA